MEKRKFKKQLNLYVRIFEKLFEDDFCFEMDVYLYDNSKMTIKIYTN
jgi:hypothetical protein